MFQETTLILPLLLDLRLADSSHGQMFYHTSLLNFLELCLDNWLSLQLTVHITSRLKILGTFSTISSLDKGTPESRKAATINGFINEFAGSFVLFFGALGLTKHFFGAEVAGLAQKAATEQGGVFDATSSAAKLALSQAHASGLGIAHLALGFLVMALVTSLGGPTGPGLNPARDFAPRLVHTFLPKSILGEHKGDSKWWYAWVPVVAPILAAILAVLLFKVIYLA